MTGVDLLVIGTLILVGVAIGLIIVEEWE